VLFALSQTLWLSLLALYLSGVCDNYSVVVRHTLVQMLTPDVLRDRVTAFNQLFIGSSNEISELRAGLGTILVVGVVALAPPSLRSVPPLPTLKPEDG